MLLTICLKPQVYPSSDSYFYSSIIHHVTKLKSSHTAFLKQSLIISFLPFSIANIPLKFSVNWLIEVCAHWWIPDMCLPYDRPAQMWSCIGSINQCYTKLYYSKFLPSANMLTDVRPALLINKKNKNKFKKYVFNFNMFNISKCARILKVT